MWRVIGIRNDGSAVIQKGDMHRVALPGQYAFLAAPHRTPNVGEWVEVLFQKESRYFEPGYYYVFGETEYCGFDEADLVRFYFHIAPEGAQALVSLVTNQLNRCAIPFGFKCLTDPIHYERADAAVLYVARRYFAAAYRQLVNAGRSLRNHLRPGTPKFTKELLMGLAVADDPGAGASFGHIRCRLLSEGIVDAWAAGQENLENKLSAVQRRFANVGLSLAQPYLKPGSVDQLSLVDEAAPSTSVFAESDKISLQQAVEPRNFPFLDVADRIAFRFCRDAIWAGGRCNWMTWSMEPRRGSPALAYKMASGRLYDGLAGIVLFLAHTAKLTGDRAQRHVVQGAIRQLRVMADSLTGVCGQFTGAAGVGRVFVLLGQLLEDESLLREGLGFVESACDQTVDSSLLDYFAGCAGVIPMLVDLGLAYGKPRFLEAAGGYGETLLQHAVQKDGVVSWPSVYARAHNLVGLADGTSGIICALAKLHALRRDERYRNAIGMALNYERASFDPTKANWPDYRQIAPSGVPAYPVAWSHGAAGIGFARLCLLRLGGSDPELRQDLEIAIRTTRNAMLQALQLEDESFSLGHGRAGCAELLLSAGEYLNRPDLLQTAEDLGRVGVDAYERNGLPWPCGLPEGKEASGLMVGSAGIGYFLLRLHDGKRVPSILSP